MKKTAAEWLKQGLPIPGNRILRMIAIDKIQVDSTYQRGLVMSSVDRIRNEFEPAALGIFQIGKRKGSGVLSVIDGQNRLAAIRCRKQNNESAPEEVLCVVHLNTTQAEEAEMFVKHNTCKAVTGNSRFRARLQYNSEPEKTIERWAKAEGFSLNFCSPGRPNCENTTQGGIRSVNCLLLAYNRCYYHLQPALKLLRMAWGNGDAKRVPFNLCTGQVVLGIALFLREQGDKDVEGIAKHFKLCHFDIGEVWASVRRNEGYGYDRPKTLAQCLTNMCRKAA